MKTPAAEILRPVKTNATEILRPVKTHAAEIMLLVKTHAVEILQPVKTHAERTWTTQIPCNPWNNEQILEWFKNVELTSPTIL